MSEKIFTVRKTPGGHYHVDRNGVEWDGQFSPNAKGKKLAEAMCAYRSAGSPGYIDSHEDILKWYQSPQDVNEVAPLAPRLVDRLSSSERKEYPITTGFLDYFPDATALVAHLSWAGNEKHNPGESLHWARSKSTDQPDCVSRHLISRDGSDFIELKDGRKVEVPHRVAMAWRAMAELQVWAEKAYTLGLPSGARP